MMNFPDPGQSTMPMGQGMSTVHMGQRMSTMQMGQRTSTMHMGNRQSTMHMGNRQSAMHMANRQSAMHMAQRPSAMHMGQRPSNMQMRLNAPGKTSKWYLGFIFGALVDTELTLFLRVVELPRNCRVAVLFHSLLGLSGLSISLKIWHRLVLFCMSRSILVAFFVVCETTIFTAVRQN